MQEISMLMDDQQNIIERLLKMSQDQQSSQLRYYSRCPIEIRVLIIGNKTAIFHKLRQEHGDIDKAILEYCAWILAISEHHYESNKSYAGMSLDEIREVSDRRMDLFIQTTQTIRAKQRERVLGLWAEIHTAKMNRGMSYRQIVTYLKKKHRFEVSRTLLNVMWKELEENNTKDDENER